MAYPNDEFEKSTRFWFEPIHRDVTPGGYQRQPIETEIDRLNRQLTQAQTELDKAKVKLGKIERAARNLATAVLGSKFRFSNKEELENAAAIGQATYEINKEF